MECFSFRVIEERLFLFLRQKKVEICSSNVFERSSVLDFTFVGKKEEKEKYKPGKVLLFVLSTHVFFVFGILGLCFSEMRFADKSFRARLLFAKELWTVGIS